jgi:glycosyltransferase involved in cell wall biosynthesis
MRIALISTPHVPVPPIARAAGAELVVSELACALTVLGHDVTTFATGDSRPLGKLRAHFAKAVWPPNPYTELAQANYACREIRRAAGSFDVVHAHIPAALPFSPFLDAPMVYTVHHDRVDGMVQFYQEFSTVNYVMISSRQAELQSEIGGARVVRHGLDPSRYVVGDGLGGYALFVGDLAKAKGPHIAIDAARAAGVPLLVAGSAHGDDRAFFQDEIEPRLTLPGIAPVGELAHQRQIELFAGARALLVPIEWEEPFGIPMIEAMLCGTPVIAFARGSVPEIVEDGRTGFVVSSADAMIAALKRAGELDRSRIRARAIERFSRERMAREYLAVYASAIERFARRDDRVSSETEISIASASVTR